MATKDVSMRRFYVYVVFRRNGTPCYVGKGQGGRWRTHITRSHNKGLRQIFAAAGGDLPIIKIRENLTEQEAYDIEIALIAAIGRARGGLVNGTDGGEGVTGYRHTEQRRKEISEFFKGRKLNANQREAWTRAGTTNSPEHRAKLSLALAGKKQPQAAIEKRAASNRGKKRSDDFCARMSALNTGRLYSAETRAKIGAASRGRKQSAETIAKRQETMDRVRAETDYHRNLGDAMKRWWERRIGQSRFDL